MMVRGIRGATSVSANTREAILEAARELLHAVVEANDVERSHIASVFFTTTQDLNAEFPAVARARGGLDRRAAAVRARDGRTRRAAALPAAADARQHGPWSR